MRHTDAVRLRVAGLRVTYPGPPPVTALNDIDLTISAGSCLCLLGESGSGKSTLARALVGLLPGAEVTGSIEINGREICDEATWQEVRWRQVSIAMSSASALNPVLRIGAQIAEPVRVHDDLSQRSAAARAAEMLDKVGLGAWAAQRYPRELSTGQRRLAMIAMALVCDAPLVLLDEPTAGLDPQTRREVLQLLGRLRDDGRSLLMLTHDVAAAHTLADEVAILYRGWLAERGPATVVLDDPRNPYTFGLLNAHPTLGSVKDLRGIRGDPPDPGQILVGCPFADRCTQVVEVCTTLPPPQVVPAGEDGRRYVACHRAGLVPVLEIAAVSKSYVLGAGMRTERVPAVVDAELTIRESEVVGLVGRNGAGKSTLGQIAALLFAADAGMVRLEGRDVGTLSTAERKRARARVQMLFPDPVEALSSRLTIGEIVQEPLQIQHLGTPSWRSEEASRLLAMVRLPVAAMLDRHAHELSTGQLQRVALARALALQPKLLVADEPVESLDPSERAKMLQLLKTLQVERGMAMLLVSHDLAVVLRVADRVVVMDRGRIVEQAPSSQLLRHPEHPVTRQLLEASGAEPSWLSPAQDVDYGHPIVSTQPAESFDSYEDEVAR